LAFNINDISSAITAANGLLMPAHFSVMITPPQWANGSQDIVRQIPMLCTSSQLPGVGFQTADIRPHGYGLFERRPIFTNFTTVNLSFYCDGQGNLIKFFQAWALNINNFNTAQNSSSSSNGAKIHDFQYPDWYETTIEIYQYDATSKKVLTWKLNRAYPLTVNNMDVSWDAENQLHKLNVEFFFYSWSSDISGTTGQQSSTDTLNYNMTRIDPSRSGALGAAVNDMNSNVYAPLASVIGNDLTGETYPNSPANIIYATID
jgi:hypothetical protein